MSKKNNFLATEDLLRKVIRESLDLDWGRRIYTAPNGSTYEFLPGGLEFMPGRNAVMVDDESSFKGILIPSEVYLKFADLLKRAHPKEFSSKDHSASTTAISKKPKELELDVTEPYKIPE